MTLTDDWRRLPVEAKADVPLDQVKAMGYVKEAGKKIRVFLTAQNGQVKGYIINTLDVAFREARLDGALDNITTEILKDSSWVVFQQIDHSIYTCGNSYFAVTLEADHATPFILKPTTTGPMKAKMRVVLHDEDDHNYYSNVINITLTKAQYAAAGTEFKSIR